MGASQDAPIEPIREVRRGQNEVGHRERSAKTEFVRHGAAKNCQEPHHSAEETSESAGLLGGKAQLFLQIDGERRERAVIREALEDFADIGDPEGTLEAVADFLEP